MFAAKIAIVLAASSLVSVASAEKNCTQSNGYKYSICGKGLKDAQQACCTSEQTCIQIKPFSGDDKITCSKERQLTGQKAVRIVIIPLFFMLLEVALAAYLVVRCDIKDPITMVCVVVVALSWPFLFSKHWTFGAYTFFLATIIAASASSKDCKPMPWYVYRLIWALGLFQIVAMLGPNEAFHVPLFGESKAASNLEFIKNVYNEKDCNTYYESYFKILDVEKEQKEFNPDRNYFGYCEKNWLATVQSFAVIHAMLWMVVVLVSGRFLLTVGNGNGGDKVFLGEVAKEP